MSLSDSSCDLVWPYFHDPSVFSADVNNIGPVLKHTKERVGLSDHE